VGPLELRILKALFLLKWVPQFKSTARNITILLIQEPNFDIRAHEQAVKQALINLESQSYLQRSGEVYEFLTDKEKDVEQEIRRTEVADVEVIKALHDVVFVELLRSNKIRYQGEGSGNGIDYSFSQKIDETLIKGKDGDVIVHLVTPEHPNYGNDTILRNQNMGKNELLAILPSTDLLLDRIRTFLKTKLYIQLNSGGEDAVLKSILDVRSLQNAARRKEISQLLTEQLRQATLVLNGETLAVGDGEPITRFNKAYQELIRSAFTKLTMIRGEFSEATVDQVVNDQDDLLEGSAIQLSEAEQEVLVDVERLQKLGERITAESLVSKFSGKPYGWSNWATLTFIARLFRLGKLELREKELLNSEEVIEALSNSRRLAGVSVRKQEQFDASTINALKRFHQDLFNVQSPGTDARSSCEAFRMAMREEAQDLRDLAAQAGTYTFLAAVKPWAEEAEAMAKKDDGYLLNQLDTFKDNWLKAEEDLLTPLKQFLNGNQKAVYDQVRAFESRYGDEFADLQADLVRSLRALLSSDKPYAGGLIPQANNAMVELQKQLDQRLQQVQADALQQIDEQEGRLKADQAFQKLDAQQQAEVLQPTATAKADVQASAKPSTALLRLNRYRTEDVPRQLQRIAALAAPPDSPPTPVAKVVPASALKPNCPLSQISNGEELQQWLEALRSAAQNELDQGHRISL